VRFAAAFAGVALLAAMMAAHGAYSLDASLPAYRAVDALSGHLKSVGSDTLGHETEAWAKGFEKLYPDVKVEIEAAGSASTDSAR
jgi:phosphate transport system substrate-binding protein